MEHFDHSLFSLAILIIASVLTSRVSARFGVPALLLFLVIGIAAGPEGFGYIAPLSSVVAREIGTVALIFILFSGGLDTEVETVKPVLGAAAVLATLGVALTTILVGGFSHLFLNATLLQGCLLRATVASTDVAAVFSVLRTKAVKLKSGIAPLLELESALNDPMAVILSIALLGLVTHTLDNLFGIVPLFFKQVIFGTLVGWGGGRVASLLINRVRLEVEGLYPVLSVGLGLLVYAFAQWIGGSGFLAAYLAGVTLGSRPLVNRRSLIQFQNGISWLVQIAMFLAMGLLIDLEQLLAVAPQGLALAAFLIFVARPLSVAVCFPGRRFTIPEKAMIAWAGLRGAVPIILTLFLLGAGIPQATAVFHLVFFVTFTSVLLQGTTVPLVARWLQVDLPSEDLPAFPIEYNPAESWRSSLVEVNLNNASKAAGQTLVDLALPKGMLVVLLRRGKDFVVPKGSTELQASDTLLVVGEKRSEAEIRAFFA